MLRPETSASEKHVGRLVDLKGLLVELKGQLVELRNIDQLLVESTALRMNDRLHISTPHGGQLSASRNSGTPHLQRT